MGFVRTNWRILTLALMLQIGSQYVLTTMPHGPDAPPMEWNVGQVHGWLLASASWLELPGAILEGRFKAKWLSDTAFFIGGWTTSLVLLLIVRKGYRRVLRSYHL
jgi:hypothetical protein